MVFNHVKTFIDDRTELYTNSLFSEMHGAEMSAASGSAARPAIMIFIKLLDNKRMSC